MCLVAKCDERPDAVLRGRRGDGPPEGGPEEAKDTVVRHDNTANEASTLLFEYQPYLQPSFGGGTCVNSNRSRADASGDWVKPVSSEGGGGRCAVVPHWKEQATRSDVRPRTKLRPDANSNEYEPLLCGRDLSGEYGRQDVLLDHAIDLNSDATAACGDRLPQEAHGDELVSLASILCPSLEPYAEDCNFRCDPTGDAGRSGRIVDNHCVCVEN